MAPEEHLSAEQLARMAAGDLSSGERVRALAHLEVCAPCGDRLATILLLRQGRPRLSRAVGAAFAVAATLLLAAALWLIGPLPPRQPAPEILSPERQALVDRWAGYARTENIDEMIYDFVLRIGYPDVIPVSPDQHLPRTRAALEDLRDGNYREAIDELAALHVEYPEFDSIAGWLGVALHVSGETDRVVEGLLQRGTESDIDPLRRWSLWYGAQHLLLTGRPEEAIPKLLELSQSPVKVGRMAKAQLEELPLDELDMGPQREPST